METYLFSEEDLNGLRSAAVVRRCSLKKVFFKISQNSLENTYVRVSFLINLHAEACNFIQTETLVQVFSNEFCGIFKYTFFDRTRSVAASDNTRKVIRQGVDWTTSVSCFQKQACRGVLVNSFSGNPEEISRKTSALGCICFFWWFYSKYLE